MLQACAGHGILLAGNSGHPTWFTVIREVTVDSCRGMGIVLSGNGWMNALTESLILRNEGEAGVRCSAVGEMVIGENRIYYNAQHGLLLDGGCARITATGNVISHTCRRLRHWTAV
ncbi:MAG: hypothetical protein BWY76_02626 [bacterium ADurb.Bin429]|nr:MAG: hypothetical protein BWY76_02626 [bacterium ADurb.Bin429]